MQKKIALEILLTTCWWLAFFLLPIRLQPFLLISLFLAGGAWAITFPRSMVRWFRRYHPSLDPQDRSILWTLRLIGITFIVISFFVVANLMSRPIR